MNTESILTIFHRKQAQSKKYLFGILPIADAFIAWINASEPLEVKVESSYRWRLRTQLVSIIILSLVVLANRWAWK